jgi:hypothetical protein
MKVLPHWFSLVAAIRFHSKTSRWYTTLRRNTGYPNNHIRDVERPKEEEFVIRIELTEAVP